MERIKRREAYEKASKQGFITGSRPATTATSVQIASNF